MQDDLGHGLELAGERGTLTGRQFWVDKGERILGHATAESSRVHLDAVLGIPLRTQISQVQVVEKGFRIHGRKGRSPETECTRDCSTLQCNPFFMDHTVGHPIHVVQKNQLGEGMWLDLFHSLLHSRMMPLKAASVGSKSRKVLLLEGSGTAGRILVSLLVVESIKVVIAPKVWIQENLPQDGLVKLGGVEFRSNLVGWHTCKGRDNPRKQTSQPPGGSFEHLMILGHVGMGKARFRPFLNVKPHHIHEQWNQELGGHASSRPRSRKAIAKDSFNPSIPPLASTGRHGVAHALPNLHGNRHIGRSPNAPPLVVGQVGIAQHANLQFKQP